MFNIRFAKDHLLHRLQAKNRHGVHSPFVYRMVDTIIYDFSNKKVYLEIENLSKGMPFDHRTAVVNTAKRRQLLYRLVAGINPQNIIQTGPGDTITTICLQKAAPNARVYALEPSSQTAAGVRSSLIQAGLDQVEIIAGNYDQTLAQLMSTSDQIDCVFFNMSNQENMTNYFELCLPKVHENTMLIFDGIYRTQQMKQAWQRIKAHPQVKVTIDLFWMGLVFFKQSQAKEDFKIKI